MPLTRRAHVIKPNKTTEAPYHWIFVDTETTPVPWVDNKERQTLRLGWACYWKRPHNKSPEVVDWLEFRDADTFWDWVIPKVQAKSRLVIIGHNVEFDIPVLAGFECLKARGWGIRNLFTRQHTNIWLFRQTSKTILVLDNLNFFRGSLAGIGESIGFEKGSVDFAKADDATLSSYCRQDVAILLKLWQGYIRFLAEENLGAFGRSVASQAMNAFRHRFMSHSIVIHDHAVALGLERGSYHGGRVEPFRFGVQTERTFYKLDVNSMYPFVMQTRPFPRRLDRFIPNPTLAELDNLGPDRGVVAECLVEVDEPVFCSYINGKLAFPVGRFRTILPGPEYAYGRWKGYIHQVLQAAVYELAPLFKEYVQHFYALRQGFKQDGNLVMDYFCKLMLNSLYGKFAQKGIEWVDQGVDESHPDKIERIWDVDAKKWYIRRRINGLLQEGVEEAEAFSSFVAISSYVTSYARLLLWWYVNQAGRQHVLYVDTDSLIVDTPGYIRLQPYIDPTKIGALKLEGTSSHLELWGSKDYVFGGETKIKGISKKAKKLNVNVYEQTYFPGLNSLLESGSVNRYWTASVWKVLARDYQKGTVNEDGSISPLVLEEW